LTETLIFDRNFDFLTKVFFRYKNGFLDKKNLFLTQKCVFFVEKRYFRQKEVDLVNSILEDLPKKRIRKWSSDNRCLAQRD